MSKCDVSDWLRQIETTGVAKELFYDSLSPSQERLQGYAWASIRAARGSASSTEQALSRFWNDWENYWTGIDIPRCLV